MQQNKEIKTVSIIGAGNVGWHMALAIHAAGFDIQTIISRSLHRAKELADLVSAEAVVIDADINNLSDLILICVSDKSLSSVASRVHLKDTIIVHTSGSTAMDVLANSSADYGVFYPLQTFTRNKEMDYQSIPFLIEGVSTDVENRLIKLAEKVSGSFYLLKSEARRKIHLAAVFACNFSNHMISVAAKIIEDEGMDRDLLFPLIDQTMGKLKTMDPVSAQTGPAARDDRGIISSHLELLEDKPSEQEIYKLLSENILRYKNEHE